MHFPSLLEIAKAEGLELVLFTGLHKFYADVLHGKSLSDLSGAPVAVRYRWHVAARAKTTTSVGMAS